MTTRNDYVLNVFEKVASLLASLNDDERAKVIEAVKVLLEIE